MIKTGVILAFCILMSLGTGFFLGSLWERRKAPPDRFVNELNLTSQQQDKLRTIWEEAMQTGGFRAQHLKQEAAQKEYHEAMRALVPAEQQQRSDEVLNAYHKKLKGIDQESKKIFDDAAERSRQVLTEEQRTKYDEIRRRHLNWMKEKGLECPGGPGGPGGPPMEPPPFGPMPPFPPPRK